MGCKPYCKCIRKNKFDSVVKKKKKKYELLRYNIL